MTKWQSILANVVIWAIPIINIWQPYIPPKAMRYIAPLIATISILTVKKTSESNPDGTDARSAYIPKKST